VGRNLKGGYESILGSDVAGNRGGGLFRVQFYQQSVADGAVVAQKLEAAKAANDDLSAKVDTLTQQLSKVQRQLADARTATAAVPAVVPAVAAPTAAPASIPSTITTLYGKTYTGCVLSRVTPDGISFIHAMGVAKVRFAELDPRLAATFGYDAAAAKKYEQDQAAQQAQSDAARAAMEARDHAAANGTAPAAGNPVAAVSPVNAAANQSLIASLQSQIATQKKEADALEAAELDAFNSYPNIYYSSTGSLEHRHTLGQSQQAVDDRAQIQSMQAQISRLQAAN
jgi:hypothetical protein